MSQLDNPRFKEHEKREAEWDTISIIISTRILSFLLCLSSPRAVYSQLGPAADSYLTRCSFTFLVCKFSRGHQVDGQLDFSSPVLCDFFPSDAPHPPTRPTLLGPGVCAFTWRKRERVLSAIGGGQVKIDNVSPQQSYGGCVSMTTDQTPIGDRRALVRIERPRVFPYAFD